MNAIELVSSGGKEKWNVCPITSAWVFRKCSPENFSADGRAENEFRDQPGIVREYLKIRLFGERYGGGDPGWRNQTRPAHSRSTRSPVWVVTFIYLFFFSSVESHYFMPPAIPLSDRWNSTEYFFFYINKKNCRHVRRTLGRPWHAWPTRRYFTVSAGDK